MPYILNIWPTEKETIKTRQVERKEKKVKKQNATVVAAHITPRLDHTKLTTYRVSERDNNLGLSDALVVSEQA